MTVGAKPLPQATRALMRQLLVHHSIRTTHVLLNLTPSGVAVSYAQVKNARQSFLRNAREARADDALRAPAAVAALPARVEPRRPLTFEEKMARIRAGARLIETPSFSKAAPDYTLGGVASGLI